MNHDYAHCSDYVKGVCHADCFRAQLTEDYRQSGFTWPVSWVAFNGTIECGKKNGDGK